LLALSNSSVAEDLEFSDSGNKVEDLDSALAHTSACGTTPGMSCAASTSVHSDGYCNKKYVVIRSFVANLSNRGPKYAKFLKTTSKYPDFFYKGPIEVVFVMLSPMSGDKKKKVQTLSEMLVDWVDSLKLKKKARGKKKWHTPSTLNVMVRSLLAAYKNFYGWEYATSDFKFDGGFKDEMTTKDKRVFIIIVRLF
jgi:hypothetical protein